MPKKPQDYSQESIPEISEFLASLGSQTYTNPDEIASSNADGLKIYNKMYLRDPYIQEGIKALISGILRSDWHIAPYSDDDKCIKIAQLVEWMLLNQDYENDEGAISQFTNQAIFNSMLLCLVYGFSITEMVWRYEPIPGYGTYYRLYLKPRSPWNITFDFDQYGNLKKDGVVESVNGIQVRHIWKDKLAIMSYDPPPESWAYGSSILQAAYRAYYLDDMQWRLRGVHSQKQAMGIKVGTIPKNASAQDIADFKTALKNVNSEGFLTKKPGFEVEVVDGPSDSTAFGSIHQDLKVEISQAITGQSLASGESKYGSRAQAGTHADSRQMRIDDLMMLLADMLNNYVIPLIIDFNIANPKGYPSFTWGMDKTKEAYKVKAIVDTAKTAGIPIVKTELYELLGLQVPTEEDETVTLESVTEEKEGGDVEIDKDEDKPAEDTSSEETAEINKEKAEEEREEYSYSVAEVNKQGKQLEDEIYSLEDEYIAKAKKPMSRLYSEMNSDIQRYVNDHWKNIRIYPYAIQKYKWNKEIIGKLHKYLSKWEVDYLRDVLSLSKKFVDPLINANPLEYAQPPIGPGITDGTTTAKAFESAMETFRAAAEGWAKLATDSALDTIWDEVKGIMRDPDYATMTYDQVIGSIDAMFEKYIMRADQKFRSVTQKPEPVSTVNNADLLYRMLRQEVEKVTGQATRQAYENTRGVIGMGFYGARDSRQSEICKWLTKKVDGKTKAFRFGHPDLPKVTPPNHPYCRTIMTPVLWYNADSFYWVTTRVPERLLVPCFGAPKNVKGQLGG